MPTNPSPSPCAESVSVLITGASSGLGAALAAAHARPDVTLFLSGRESSRLEQTAERCRALGAEVITATVDVTDRAAMTAWVTGCDRHRPLDLVIANAGLSAGTAGGAEDETQTRTIFAVNLDGVINTVLPAVAPMRARGYGRIAVMSSLAGFRGLGGAPAYCASKAAVRVWGEALRGALAADGITVSVICPGFIATPMTAVNDFPMPFLMDADRAARRIRDAIARGRGRIAFPGPIAALAWAAAVLPDALIDRLGRLLPAKTGQASVGTITRRPEP